MDWNSDIRVGLFNALKCTNGNYGTHAFMELHTVVYIHSDRSSSVNNETLKKTITAQREHDCLIVFFFFLVHFECGTPESSSAKESSDAEH